MVVLSVLVSATAAWSSPDYTGTTPPAASAKPSPDVLQMKDGERLVGHLQRISGGRVYFHSNLVGDVSVSLDEVQELSSSSEFAVLKKGIGPSRQMLESQVPVGRIAVTADEVKVAGSSAVTVPVKETEFVVDRKTFENDIRQTPAWTQGWHGTISGGAGGVASTQDSLSFNEAVSLARVVPVEPWLPVKDRTTINFTGAYSRVTQPGVSEATTNILHGDAEHDYYLSDRMFFLQQARFDHNSAQGLDFQQLYGAGLGCTVVKDTNQELDLRADLHYERQQFDQSSNQNSEDLIGSNLTQNYTLKLPMGMTLNQQALFDPAWNNTNAFSASAKVRLAVPIYRRLGLSLGLTDNFLNNPPDGYKRNSAQFTTGLTYKFN